MKRIVLVSAVSSLLVVGLWLPAVGHAQATAGESVFLAQLSTTVESLQQQILNLQAQLQALLAQQAAVSQPAATIAPSPEASAISTYIIEEQAGATGENVARIQQALRNLGHFPTNLKLGYYGTYTKAAVEKFQQANGLPVSGNVDVATAQALSVVAQRQQVVGTAPSPKSTGIVPPQLPYGPTGGARVYVATAPDDAESKSGVLPASASKTVLVKFRFTAAGETVSVKKLKLLINNERSTVSAAISTNEIPRVYLYDGTTQIGSGIGYTPDSITSLLPGAVIVTDLDWTIPQDGTRTLTVKADTNAASDRSRSGRSIYTHVRPDGFEAVSVSGVVIASNGPYGGALGNKKVFYKTYPEVTVAGPGTVLTNGSNDLIRFTVTNKTGNGVLSWNVLSFDVYAAAATVPLFGPNTAAFTLRDMTNALNLMITKTATTGTAQAGNYTFYLGTEEVIPAGASREYKITGTLWAPSSNSSVSTQLVLRSDTSVANIRKGVDYWTAAGTPPSGNGGCASNANYSGFVWSDNSAVGHSLATPDWANGVYINTFPSDTLTRSNEGVILPPLPTGTTDPGCVILTVTKDGTAPLFGSVWSNPDGISCDAACTTRTASFLARSTVRLNAVASSSAATFSGWRSSSGECHWSTLSICDILMDRNKSVTATFNALTTQPSITVLEPNGGESLGIGNYNTIKWQAIYPSSGYVALMLDNDPGGTVGTITNIFFPPSASGQYSWDTKYVTDSSGKQITVQPGRYKMRAVLVDYSGPQPVTYIDTSDAPFSIVSATSTQQLTVSLTADTPLGTNIASGQTNTLLTKIKLTNNGNTNIPVLSFRIVSDSLNANSKISRILVYDDNFTMSVTGYLQPAGLDGLYQEIFSFSSPWIIPSYSSKTVSIVADVKTTSPSGPIRLGLGSLTATYVGDPIVLPIYGNNFSIVSTIAQPSITVLSPNGGETFSDNQIIPISVQIESNKQGKIKIWLINESNSNIFNVGIVDIIPGNIKYLYTVNLNLPELRRMGVSIPKPSSQYRAVAEWKSNDGVEFLQDGSDNQFSIVASSTNPSITLLSPNGGETWQRGSTQTIWWKGGAAKSIAIHVTDWAGCTISPCPVINSYTITQGISNSGSFEWVIGSGGWGGRTVPDGRYVVNVIGIDTAEADASDAPFTIVSSSVNTPPKIIGIPVVPPGIAVGQSVNFAWEATDADNDPLTWKVTWGDGSLQQPSLCSSPNCFRYSESHAWSAAGTYTVTATVSDPKGGTAQHILTVAVGLVSVNTPPRIIGIPAVPAGIAVGQSVNFAWEATDADNDPLTWKVTWGDGSLQQPSLCSSPNCFRYSESHAWSAAGTYTVTAAVSDPKGGTAQHMFIVAVISVPSSDFSIQPIAAQSVAEGGTVRVPVSISYVSGARFPVTFSASGLPKGAPYSFSPTSCEPSCASYLTISIPYSSLSGSLLSALSPESGGSSGTTRYYTITVTGKSDVTSHSTSFSLAVYPAVGDTSAPAPRTAPLASSLLLAIQQQLDQITLQLQAALRAIGR